MQQAWPQIADRLVKAGWTFASCPKSAPPLNGAGAVTDWPNRQIVMATEYVRNPTTRVRWYVAIHECGHALDVDAGLPSVQLGAVLEVPFVSAREALAEAVAYQHRRTSRVRGWILNTFAWRLRRKHAVRVRWGDVVHDETADLAKVLILGRDGEPGRFWVFNSLGSVERRKRA